MFEIMFYNNVGERLITGKEEWHYYHLLQKLDSEWIQAEKDAFYFVT